MITLQERVYQKVNELSEENLRFLLEMIERFMCPDSGAEKMALDTRRIGIAKGQNLYDDDYDFDELNSEIAEMFGGDGMKFVTHDSKIRFYEEDCVMLV